MDTRRIVDDGCISDASRERIELFLPKDPKGPKGGDPGRT